MWEFHTDTTPKAQKEYRCDACDTFADAGFTFRDIAPEDWQVWVNAKREGCRILADTRYYKTEGVFDGEFTTFRGRVDVTELCEKYDLFGN